MSVVFLFRGDDNVATGVMEALGNPSMGNAFHTTPFPRVFGEPIELKTCAKRPGRIRRDRKKESADEHVVLVCVKKGATPGDAVAENCLHTCRLIYVAAASRHYDWVKAHRGGRVGRDLIAVRDDANPVAGFANALLLQESARSTSWGDVRQKVHLAQLAIRLFVFGKEKRPPPKSPYWHRDQGDYEKIIGRYTD